MQPLGIAKDRWHQININLITKLPTTDANKNMIVTFIDCLTKRALCVATSEENLTVQKFTEIFTEHYLRLHGLPDVIVSDREVRFLLEF
jgi:hypothetical protein